ncbi:SGNH/GDSL hydrolase family protein [Fulvivirga lutea]|uniref:SGNH/GDSL hydrolase family protein n=1 Tax=Fulvivirga lutea TaxID=2810512 RepID=A0A975A1B4_9BACT|nr:SGNH/GDSL hydrolase family protein [Fulvivirga lutea]QSE97347.1 SGNH/GDSL hydrolase family protein [Fulvivirga lutea]
MKLALINLLIICCFLTACAEDDTTSPNNTQSGSSNPIDDSSNPSKGELKLLFIGNSLTYTNNLPQLVEKLGEDDDYNLVTSMIAEPNYALEDHINDGEIQGLIETQEFDFVIIQQGPSSQAYGRESLISFGGQIKEMCDNGGAQLIYFMVWPAITYYYTFDGVIANYTNAATINNALLAPVGKVWKKHFDLTNDFSYYGPDSFHPSVKGSEKAAEIIWKTIMENN